jgi:hypothetical protein
MPWWVTLKDKSAFCLVIEGDKVRKIGNKHQKFDEGRKMHVMDWEAYKADLNAMVHKIASKYGEVDTIQTLPYAANPVKGEDPNTPCHEWTLCYTPRECAGKTSCPRSRACSE